jgi:integrase
MAMSVTVRPYRRGGWEVDITVRLPNGSRWRERSKAPVSSKTAAMRWGEDRERHVLQHGLPQPKKEVPTLEEFAPRFLDGHAHANRQKPSGIVSKESILHHHLIPLLGSKKLDAITTEHVQNLKRGLRDRAPKTVNNVLTVLNVLLKKAVEWNVIDRVPCVIRLLPIPKPSAGFYDFEEYERLIQAAKVLDRTTYLIVLLGGDAGLRCGEIMALEWRDVDLHKRQLCVQRSDWKEGRAASIRAADRPIGDGAPRTSPFAIRPGLVSARWVADVGRHREASCRTSGATRAHRAKRRSPPSPYVLFASGDAWSAGARDSGARGTSGPQHDAAVHAPESGGD